MMADKTELRGLLTLLVTPAQAVEAVHAVYPGAYRAGGSLYRDDEDDWFHPIGTLKMAGDGTAEPENESPATVAATTETSQENEPMTVMETVTAVAKKTGEFLGLVESEDVKQFRQCKTMLARKAETAAKSLALSERLTAAKAANASGVAEFEGRIPSRAVLDIEHQFFSARQTLADIQRAESEMIGLCPDEGLQRERRQLMTQRRQIYDAIANCERRLDEETKNARNLESRKASFEKSIESGVRIPTSELADVARKLGYSNTYVAELKEELEALRGDQRQLEVDKLELYDRMRAVEV